MRAAIHPNTAANPAPAYEQGDDTMEGRGKPPVWDAGFSREPSITFLAAEGQRR